LIGEWAYRSAESAAPPKSVGRGAEAPLFHG
jgi:hypothetical protein